MHITVSVILCLYSLLKHIIKINKIKKLKKKKEKNTQKKKKQKNKKKQKLQSQLRSRNIYNKITSPKYLYFILPRRFFLSSYFVVLVA